MDNQHKHIKGYRELINSEIDLMNRIKQKGLELEASIAEVQAHIQSQRDYVERSGDSIEGPRLNAAAPERWVSIARTDLQTGMMALIRAVAQPTTFS